MNGLIDDNLKDELNRMEMLHPGEEPTSLFFVVEKEAAEPRIRVALEQASHYCANAVFFRTFPKGDKRSPIPQIYIYHNTDLSLDSSKYAGIHRRLWNAGIVPLAFIITANQIKIINCRQAPEIDEATNDPVFTPFRNLEKIVDVDRAFVTHEVASGTFWDHPEFKNDFVLEKTAYFKLLTHLKSLKLELLKRKILPESTVNRILVMAILVKYLNDRRDSAGNSVFQKGFLRQFSHANDDDLESLFREKGSCIKLFNHLSEHFNGDIFELTDNEQAELEKADLSLIADFLKGDQDTSGQRLFWPLYSFGDLPVELISNIYEEFLAEKNRGVVYTPPMLVDFLLDQCLPLDPQTLTWKILDPACGSGIFLVGAFKRLLQCWRIAHDWKKPTHLDLRKILKESIFGFDEKSEAIRITAFSLCVALCDELEPLVIWNELKFDNLKNRNLQDRDFFEILESGEFKNYFNLIIGNPPFKNKLTTEAAKRVEKISAKHRPKLPYGQLALLFLEQSFRFSLPESRVCLIQPAGPLLYNGKALSFRSYLFDKFAINQVFDFTPLEGELFQKVKVAAAAIIGRNAPASTDKILHLTFRRTKAIKEKLLFELDPYDFHWITRKSVKKNRYCWKANLLGGGRLHRILNRLVSDVPTLGEYLEEKRKKEGWQFGEGYTVGCGRFLNRLNTKDLKELCELSPEARMNRFQLKRTPKLAQWITGKPNLPPKALTKEGIDRRFVRPCAEHFFQETCSSTKEIFLPPHALIREVPEDLSIPAIFSDKKLVFSTQIIGIHAPEKDKNKLQMLAHNLNNSRLYGVLAAVLSSRMLVSRASSLLKSDIMALPYSDDPQKIELNYWEQAIIDDIGNYLINFRHSGENSLVLSEADKLDLRCFGEMYCSLLNSVYEKLRPLQPILMDSFICYPFCYGDSPQIELPPENEIVPFLKELLHRKLGSRLFVNRILRLYDQNVIFMIKPNQKRYWLRSIALRDADETLIDLLEQGYWIFPEKVDTVKRKGLFFVFHIQPVKDTPVWSVFSAGCRTPRYIQRSNARYLDDLHSVRDKPVLFS